MVGLSEGYDVIACRGDPDDAEQKGFALFYLKNSRLIAVDCVGRPKEFMAGKQLVKARTHVKAALLADEGVEPADFIQGNLD
jgi:3-phenylpropionate/trans-cinnamate dioxygenase ferredoxin reductase subunit